MALMWSLLTSLLASIRLARTAADIREEQACIFFSTSRTTKAARWQPRNISDAALCLSLPNRRTDELYDGLCLEAPSTSSPLGSCPVGFARTLPQLQRLELGQLHRVLYRGCVFPFQHEQKEYSTCLQVHPGQHSVCPSQIKVYSNGSSVVTSMRECFGSSDLCPPDSHWMCNGECVGLSEPCLQCYPLPCKNKCARSTMRLCNKQTCITESERCGDDGSSIKHEDLLSLWYLCSIRSVISTDDCGRFCPADSIYNCDGRCDRRYYEHSEYYCGSKCQKITEACDGKCLTRNSSFSANYTKLTDGDYFVCPNNSTRCIRRGDTCTGLIYISDDVCKHHFQRRQVCEAEHWRHSECEAEDHLVRCQGHRPGQCIQRNKLCDGSYDCFDRSDETNCANDASARQHTQSTGAAPLEEKPDLCFDDASMLDPASVFDSLEDCVSGGGHGAGLKFHNHDRCIPNYVWCGVAKSGGSRPSADGFTDDSWRDCPNYDKILHSPIICQNHTFWSRRPCQRGHRCTGNWPGQCGQWSYKYRSWDPCDEENRLGAPCKDNSNLVCNASKKAEGMSEMWLCKDSQTFVHHSLVCDGYLHCGDESDEDPEICRKCQKMYQQATFSCLHKYTNRPMCAGPCNGINDACGNDEDEACVNSNALIAACLTVGLLLLTVVISEYVLHCAEQFQEDHVSLHLKDGKTIFKMLICIESYIALPRSQKWAAVRIYCRMLRLYTKLHSNQDGFDAGVLFGLVSALKTLLSRNEVERAILLIHAMECHIHGYDNLAKDQCLKKHLGTSKIAGFFFSIVEPGLLSAIVQRLVPDKMMEYIDTKSQSKYVMTVSTLVVIMIKTILYYTDLVKDILLVYYLKTFTSDDLSTFRYQAVVILIFSIVAPQLLNMAAFVAKSSLNLWTKLLLSMTFPMLPGVAIYQIAKLDMNADHRCTKQQVKSSTDLMTMVNSIAFQQHQIMSWKNMLAIFLVNENALEHIVQIIILLLLTFLTYTQTKVIQGFQTLFAAEIDLLILSALLSMMTLAKGPVIRESLVKDEFIGTKGKVLLLAYHLCGALARVSAFIVYFTPSLGLFDTLMHWKMGKINVAFSNIPDVYDVVLESNASFTAVYFKDAWITVSNPTDLAGLTYEIWLGILMSAVCIHYCLVFLIKLAAGTEFIQDGTSVFSKFLHLLGNTVSPTGYKEWDATYDEQPHNFRTIWNGYHREMCLLLTLFCMENILLCLPVWILWHNINQREEFLDEYFSPLAEERRSKAIVQGIGTTAPAVFILLAVLQYASMRLYFSCGHPWSRIYNQEQRNLRKQPSKTELEEIELAGSLLHTLESQEMEVTISPQL